MVGHKYEWGEHHCEIPIIYAAVGAATVAENPRMEGTEEEYAYHVANSVGKAYKQQYPLVDNIGKEQVRDANGKVETYPCGGADKGSPPWNVGDL